MAGGGISPYEYSHDGGGTFQSSGNFTNLAANSYNMVIMDNNSCSISFSLSVSGPATALTGTITSQTDVACGGTATGSVTVEGSGGTSPYEYSLNGGVYQTSGTFGNLSEGKK